MAFTSAITESTTFGNKKVTFGTFTTSSTDTGGDINTGLATCEFIKLNYSGASAGATCPMVNETLPIAGSAVTIVHAASADGYWWAFGY
jgi:hypothetical protein